MSSSAQSLMNIVVLEPDGQTREALRGLLAPRGFQVHAATTLPEALALLALEEVGCLLAAHHPPALDALEAFHTVRRQQPFCSVLLLTTHEHFGIAIEAIRAGAADYLEKPFTDVTLPVTKVERALRARKLELERLAFAEKMRTYEQELDVHGEQVRKQHAEIQMFEQILELRVRQATEELQERCAILEGCLTTHLNADYAAKLHAESILEYLRAIQVEETEGATQLRAVLARLSRRLEAHVGLFGKSEPGTAPRLK